MEEINGCQLSKEKYLCLLLDATKITFHIDMCRDRLSFTLAGQCGATRVFFNNPIAPNCVNRVHELLQLTYCSGKDVCTNITSAPLDNNDITTGLSQALAHKIEDMVCAWAHEHLYGETQRLIHNSLEAQDKACKN